MNRLPLLVIALSLTACMKGRVESSASGDVEPMMRVDAKMLASWPMKNRETANTLLGKYGQPDVVDDQVLIWHNRGPFVKIALMRDAVQHDWPMPHTDFLTQTVKHRVPADKVEQLWRFDGSVWAHRTRGELMAQCDIEANNYLALNVAHDLIMGKRSVSEARDFFAKTAMAYKNGDRSSPYMNGLLFAPEPSAADRDMPHKM